MGPTVTKPVQDPLAVTCLENRLYILLFSLQQQSTTLNCLVGTKLIDKKLSKKVEQKREALMNLC